MRRFSVLLIFLLAACAGTGQNSTVEPASTSTLIRPTETATEVPPTATPTPQQNIIAPGAHVIVVTAPTSVPFADTGQSLIQRDPVAAELMRIAQEQVSRQTNLPTRRVLLVDIRPIVWTDSTLNCPLPDSEAIPMSVDGYRILLQAGSQEYLFHTDFDQVILCDMALEQLPDAEATADSTAEVTPETTAEASS